MFGKKMRVLIYSVPVFCFILISLFYGNSKDVSALEKESILNEMNLVIMPKNDINKNFLYVNTTKDLNIEEDTSLIQQAPDVIVEKKEAEKTNNKEAEKKEKKNKLSETQKIALEAGNKKISGYSQIFGNIKDITIIDYLNKLCRYLEKNSKTKIDLDTGMFLALLYQESRCSVNINDGIAQITIFEDATCLLEDEELSISINNTNNPIESIDWTVINFINKYSTLLEYRKDNNYESSVSPWYVLKIHNSGVLLQKLRYNYKEKYELSAEGDDLFVKDFESFGKIGKKMFKEYLGLTENSKAIRIADKIDENTTYEDYTSFSFLYSDPKYIENIKQYYIQDVD